MNIQHKLKEKLKQLGIIIKSPMVGLIDNKFNSCVLKQIDAVELLASTHRLSDEILRMSNKAKVSVKLLESRLSDNVTADKPFYFVCAYKNNLFEIADYYKFSKEYNERITELAQQGE